MRRRWSLVLPLCGLLLFAIHTEHSLRMDREIHRVASRYFWWGSLRLDRDPLNRQARTSTASPCKDGGESCVSWDPEYMDVDPGWFEKSLMFTSIPAFIVGFILVGGLSRLGISQVLSFMLAMPPLIAGWLCFVGWVIDRWRHKRRVRAGLAQRQ